MALTTADAAAFDLKHLNPHQRDILGRLTERPYFRCSNGWRRQGDSTVVKVATMGKLEAFNLVERFMGPFTPGLRISNFGVMVHRFIAPVPKGRPAPIAYRRSCGGDAA